MVFHSCRRDNRYTKMILALLVLNCNVDIRSRSDPIIVAKASDVISEFGYSEFEEFIICIGRTVAKRTPPGRCLTFQDKQFFNVHSYNRNGLCSLGFMDKHYPVPIAFSLLNKVLNEYEKNLRISWRNVQENATYCICNLLQLITCNLIKILQVVDHENQKNNFVKSWRSSSVQGDNDDRIIIQPWPYLNEFFTKFQDPLEADELLNKIDHEMIKDHDDDDDQFDHQITNHKLIIMSFIDKKALIILEKIFVSLLERGERLDSLRVVLNKISDSVVGRGEDMRVEMDSLVENRHYDLIAASQMFYNEAAQMRTSQRLKRSLRRCTIS